MWVKICANTNLDDARLAADLGADAVGFVFAPSKRQVTPAQVAQITEQLPESVNKVGVFSTQNAQEILTAATEARLTAVQLHSAFSPQLLADLEAGSDGLLGVFQVIAIPEEFEEASLREALRQALTHPFVLAVLLDASHGGTSGGTGTTFDWQRAVSIVREVQAETGGQIIIAGGLRPENVGEAIRLFHPFGVDVASGVEASPGKKDPQRLRAFLAAAKGA